MLQEEGLEVCHTVIVAKQTPYFFSVGIIAVVPLVTLELCKFIYERPVYDKLLVAVRPRRLIFVRADTLNEEARHL